MKNVQMAKLNFGGGGKVLIINMLDYRMHLLLDFEN